MTTNYEARRWNEMMALAAQRKRQQENQQAIAAMRFKSLPAEIQTVRAVRTNENAPMASLQAPGR